MNLNEYSLQWLKWHGAYERYAFKVFRKALKESIQGIPIYNLTYDNYQLVIPLNIRPEPIKAAYYEVYKRIGFIHGARIGRGINRELKDFNLPFFNEVFFKDMIEWLNHNAGDRIISVNETLRGRISLAVEVAARKGMSVEEMQEFLRKTVDSNVFTKYMALRIARTETTTAANFGAMVSGDSSRLVLEKIWISTKDSHTRDGKPELWNHVEMNGVAVGQYELFHMESRKGEINNIAFPAAHGSSKGNGINCRCTIALKPKRDADGFPIRR